jgi:hypothetical protein
MRYLRLFCATVTLICALAFSAYAGEIECDGITIQPSHSTVMGDIECDLTKMALSLIQTVLSIS